MFKFFKEKLKGAIEKFSKNVEEEAEDVEVTEEDVEEQVSKERSKKAEDISKKKAEKKEKPKKKSADAAEEKKPAKKEPKKPIPKKPKPVKLTKEEKALSKKKETPAEIKKELDDFDKKLEDIDLEIEKENEAEEAIGVEKRSEPEDTVKEPEEQDSEKDDEPVAKGKEEVTDKESEEDTTEKEEEPLAEPAQEKGEPEDKPKKGFFARLFKKKDDEEPVEEQDADEPTDGTSDDQTEDLLEVPDDQKEETPKVSESETDESAEETVEAEPTEKVEPEKQGFFSKLKKGIAAKKLSEDKFEDLFFELEVALLENNVAVEVIEKIKTDLKDRLVGEKLDRFKITQIIEDTLKKSLTEILEFTQIDLLEKAKENKPLKLAFIGVNGSGKTTTIAKVAKLFQNNDLTPVLVAADTFRAAAIQQLEEHADKLGVKMIKHDYGSDPAAVAFDGIKYAEAKGADVVLIDTAGRLHSNINLMDEMKKIVRVAKPDMVIFIGESITGNDCIEQVQKFNEATPIDGIILSKADIDEKGGAAISVSYVTGKPIMYLGTGQEYEDLEVFDKKKILANLGLDE